MARDFTPTDDLVNTSDIAITGYPVSASMWFWPDADNAQYTLFGLTRNDALRRMRIFANGTVAGDPCVLDVHNGSANSVLISSNGFTAGQWNHVAGVWTSTTAWAIFCNGTKTSGSVTARDPFISPNMNRTALGALYINSTELLHLNGRLAEGGVWDVALTDDEVNALSVAYSPRFVRPQNLQHYWPLRYGESPERDWGIQHFDMTVSGTSVISHPPIIYPRPAQFFPAVSGAATTPVSMSAAAEAVSSFQRQAALNLNMTADGAVSIQKQSTASLAAIAFGVATLVKKFTVSRSLSAVAVGIANLTKQSTTALSATATGVTTLARTISVSVNAVAVGVTSLRKQVSKTLSAIAGGIATLATLKAFGIQISAVAVGIATLAKQSSFTKALSAVASGVATLAKQISVSVALSATAAGVASLQKQAFKTLSAIGLGATDLAAGLRSKLTLPAFADGVASLSTKLAIGRFLTATAAGVASLNETVTFSRLISATASGAATIQKQAKITLKSIGAGLASMTVQLTGLKVSMTAVANGVASLKETMIFKNTLDAVALGVVSIQRKVFKTLRATGLGLAILGQEEPPEPLAVSKVAARWYKGLFRGPGKKGAK